MGGILTGKMAFQRDKCLVLREGFIEEKKIGNFPCRRKGPPPSKIRKFFFLLLDVWGLKVFKCKKKNWIFLATKFKLYSGFQQKRNLFHIGVWGGRGSPGSPGWFRPCLKINEKIGETEPKSEGPPLLGKFPNFFFWTLPYKREAIKKKFWKIS